MPPLVSVVRDLIVCPHRLTLAVVVEELQSPRFSSYKSLMAPLQVCFRSCLYHMTHWCIHVVSRFWPFFSAQTIISKLYL
jgi:hypothetical protein